MAYDDARDEQIRDQLLEIENDLLDIAIVDRPTLQGFVARLAHVTEETTRCLKHGQLSPNTIRIARNVALSGKLIADNLLRLRCISSDVARKRELDIAEVFARMTLNESRTAPLSNSDKAEDYAPLEERVSGRIKSTCDGLQGSMPSYVKNARAWLLRHLFNPYPTHREKLEILQGSSVPVKTIDNWFTHARRRIGWSALANRFFRNSRSELIDCAFRFFIRPDPTFPVSQEIAQLFKEMEANVEKLYNDDAQVSKAAKMLENVIKRPSPKTLPNEGKKRKVTKAQRASIVCPSNLKTPLRTNDMVTTAAAPRSTLNQDFVRSSVNKRKTDATLELKDGRRPTSANIRPIKRRRASSHVSSDSSDSSLGPSTPYSTLLTLPTICHAFVETTCLNQSTEAHISDSSCTDKASVCLQSERKHRLCDSERDDAPLSKRPRQAAATMTGATLPTLDSARNDPASNDVRTGGMVPDTTISHNSSGRGVPAGSNNLPDLRYPTLGLVDTDWHSFNTILEVHAVDWKGLLPECDLDQTLLGPSLDMVNLLAPQHVDLSTLDLSCLRDNHVDEIQPSSAKASEAVSFEGDILHHLASSDFKGASLHQDASKNDAALSSMGSNVDGFTYADTSSFDLFPNDTLVSLTGEFVDTSLQQIPPSALPSSILTYDSCNEWMSSDPFFSLLNSAQ